MKRLITTFLLWTFESAFTSWALSLSPLSRQLPITFTSISPTSVLCVIQPFLLARCVRDYSQEGWKDPQNVRGDPLQVQRRIILTSFLCSSNLASRPSKFLNKKMKSHLQSQCSGRDSLCWGLGPWKSSRAWSAKYKVLRKKMNFEDEQTSIVESSGESKYRGELW